LGEVQYYCEQKKKEIQCNEQALRVPLYRKTYEANKGKQKKVKRRVRHPYERWGDSKEQGNQTKVTACARRHREVLTWGIGRKNIKWQCRSPREGNT